MNKLTKHNTTFTRKEKEVVSILSIGTLLEYFDFYLYIHMATVLNKAFFATGDEKSALLLTSFAYLSSYIFRPIGAVFFGWLGDKYGRKFILNITFFLMGLVSLGIFFLPTYDDIGVWASIMITLFRAIQGISTMGEIIGGEIYLNEYMKGRKAPIAIGFVFIGCWLGGQSALYAIMISNAGYIHWRYLFLFGLAIFIIGSIARRNLLETVDFIKSCDKNTIDDSPVLTKKTMIMSIFLEITSPTFFFIVWIGLNSILTTKFGYTQEDIISNGSLLGYALFAGNMISLLLAYKYYPLRISIYKNLIGILLFASVPFILNMSTYYVPIILLQGLLMSVGDDSLRGSYTFNNIPIRSRFKIGAIAFALSRAVVALLTTLGLIYLEPFFGNYIYAILGLPCLIARHYALKHFEVLDTNNKHGLIHHYKEVKGD